MTDQEDGSVARAGKSLSLDHHEKSEAVPLDRVVEMLSRHGQVVYNEGPQDYKRILVGLQWFHGHGDNAEEFLRNPAARETYSIHQQHILKCLNDGLTLGPDKARFFIEKIRCHGGQWDPEEHQLVKAIYRSVQPFRGITGDRLTFLQSLAMVDLLESGMEPNVLLDQYRGTMLFAGECLEQNLDHLLYGVTTPEFEDIGPKESSDEKIADAINFFNQEAANLMAQHVPPGGVGFLVTGGAHFKSGYQQQAPVSHPVEAALGEITGARVLVLEPAGLQSLSLIFHGHKFKYPEKNRVKQKLRETEKS